MLFVVPAGRYDLVAGGSELGDIEITADRTRLKILP
jgi:hypothetical protein